MLIVGYCFGIRSERRLCEEVHLNLAYRWFCRLGLEDQVPDHSTFSKNRHGRFRDSDTLRFVFEQVLERCVREGLVGGEGFAIDARLVKADANRQRGVPGTEADWSDRQSISRPGREYLAALDQAEVEKATPENVSLTDPAAQWSAAGGPAFYAYSANYLIDTAAGIVVDVAATPASQADCAAGPMKARCCANTPMRKIARSVHESARDLARGIAKSSVYKQSRKDRKKVEMLFAHLKRILKLDRLRLRGLSGAKDEFLLAAAAQNLRRMAKWLAPIAEKGELVTA